MSSPRDNVVASCAASLSVSEAGLERAREFTVGFLVFLVLKEVVFGLRAREVVAAGIVAVERQVEASREPFVHVRANQPRRLSLPSFTTMTSSKEDSRVSIETMGDWSHIKENYTQAVRASVERELATAGMSKSNAISQHLDQVSRL